MSAKSTKLAERLSDILVLLNEGKRVDIHILSEKFGVSLRTIQRLYSFSIHQTSFQRNQILYLSAPPIN